MIILVLLAAVLFLPRVFGITPYAVLSGSMEPTYHVGSLIYVADVEPEKIQVGDPMTFRISGDTLVTHRVIEKNEEEKNFRTQGDANENPDGGTVAYAAVVGKPLFTIPLLGYLAVYVGTRSGMIILGTVVAVVLILTFLPDLLLGKGKEKDGGAK